METTHFYTPIFGKDFYYCGIVGALVLSSKPECCFRYKFADKGVVQITKTNEFINKKIVQVDSTWREIQLSGYATKDFPVVLLLQDKP